jgi:hypothetical protein
MEQTAGQHLAKRGSNPFQCSNLLNIADAQDGVQTRGGIDFANDRRVEHLARYEPGAPSVTVTGPSHPHVVFIPSFTHSLIPLLSIGAAASSQSFSPPTTPFLSCEVNFSFSKI